MKPGYKIEQKYLPTKESNVIIQDNYHSINEVVRHALSEDTALILANDYTVAIFRIKYKTTN